LCAVLARTDLASDPRLATPSVRQINREFALDELRKTFAACKVGEVSAKLDAAGVPNGRINDLKQVFEMEQARERGLKVEFERSDGTKIAGVGNPIRLSATPVQYRCAAPKLGEHTAAVIRDWLDAGADEIEELRAAGALG
jgi:crotonobetainyl-CoA:carnitine CoA-transferase CaiB-like acyl-CoA transferase